MAYTPNLDDKNSPYYYGMDGSYRVESTRRPKTQRPRVKSPLLADDPELQGYDLTRKTEKSAAPAQPADSSIISGPNRPSTAPTPAPSTEPGSRVNANGIKQYGRDLSSLNAFTSAFTGGYELADISTAFQSEDLPVKGSRGTNTDYSLEDAEAMGVSKEDALTISEGGYVETLIEPSTPGTTGNNPANAQDGTSDKPDIAENVRTIRMQRKGPRDEGSFRGFQKDNNNRLAQQSQAEKPDAGKIAQEKRRNAIRSTFLDMDTPIIKASVAANALAGYGKDSDGNAQFNYGGKLVQAKDGMQQQAKNAAMMGQDPSQYLDIPTTSDTEPDKPANSELNPALASTVKPGTIEMPENTGGSIETPEIKTKPSAEKYQETQNFLSGKMSMLTRKTK